MIQSKLDEDLLEEELNSYPGRENRVAIPFYAYEGYYHSLATSETVYLKNPNPFIGTDFDKAPASAFTREFYEAFRLVNKANPYGERQHEHGALHVHVRARLPSLWADFST
jgi:hypothetical protein